jgi:hypothetical protein
LRTRAMADGINDIGWWGAKWGAILRPHQAT